MTDIDTPRLADWRCIALGSLVVSMAAEDQIDDVLIRSISVSQGAPCGASDNDQAVAAFQLHTPLVRNLYTFLLKTRRNLSELVKGVNLLSHKALLEPLNEEA